jgi:Sec-independent protein translocase protein TatA
MERVYTTPLLDKLGIRPGMRVAILGVNDDVIRPLIAERTTDLTDGWPEPDTDVVLLAAESPDQLAPLADLAKRIRPNGAIWVVSRKGKAATLRYEQLLDAARAPASSTTRSPRSRRPTRPCVWSSRALFARADPPRYHPHMQDLGIVLIVILILVLLWRGPKTLPKLGQALGRGVREARKEASKAQAEIQSRTSGESTPTPPTDRDPPDAA